MARVQRRLHNATVSRLKSFLTFTDIFANAFKSGWKVIRSGWSVGANIVSSATTNFPINTVKMANENVTISLKDPGAGTGAALWVSDDGNWWSVVSKQEQCSGCGSCTSVAAYNPCGYTNPCVGTGGTTNPCVATGGYTNPCVATGGYTNPCVATGGNTIPGVYNACGATNPYVCNPVYYSTTPGYYTCSMYNPSGYCKYGFYTPASTTGPYGGNCSGGNCASTYVPERYVPINPCGSGGNYVPVNPCGSGGTYVPVNPCGSGGNTNPYNPCGSGGTCVGTGGNCLSYANTYPRYIRIYKYVSNAITQMASITLDSLTSFPVLRGLKVYITNASKQNSTATITARAYSDTSMVTQIGNDLVYSATGVNIITNYGIIASDSAYNQTLTIKEVDIR